MDVGKASVNVELTNMDPRSPSDEDPTSTDSELNVPKKETVIDEAEEPPIASEPGELPVTAQTVSQIRQSQITSNRKHRLLLEEYNKLNGTQRKCRRQVDELNSNLESKISEISQLDLSLRTCRKNLSALNSNLTFLKRMHTELRQQFTEKETQIRSFNEINAQVCELLTSRREQTCPQDWIRNEDRCYFISTFERSYDAAKQHCCNSGSKLLEMNSTEEENFFTNTVGDQGSSYWIGKCKDGEVASNVVFKMNAGKFECSECKSRDGHSCNNDQHRFICEESAPLCPYVPEVIQLLCQEAPGSAPIEEQRPLSPPSISMSFTNPSSLP